MLSSPTVAGSLILQARLRANLSQRDLARRAATAQSTIAAYERGRKD
ncbi:MAG: helix-turn-helix transcriptional regulator, partial [bacterium]|nr:helix-turn-helix transcriptional regulator [bacterium]